MKTLITGAGGFLGKHLSPLIEHPCDVNRFDLMKYYECNNYTRRRDRVYHLAADVGGIGYLMENQQEVLYNNTVMGLNILRACIENGVSEFYNIASVCSYPDVMLKEECLNFGLPVAETIGYGLAKRFILNSVNISDIKSCNLILTNLYGPGDNSSHVVPMLIKKVIKAKLLEEEQIEVWGKPDTTRDFLFVKDAANIIAEMPCEGTINIASGEETKIKTLVDIIVSICHYRGRIVYTGAKVGQKRRKIDIKKMTARGFSPQTTLEEGLEITVGACIDALEEKL